MYFDDYQENYTTVESTLGWKVRDLAEGETVKAVEAIIAEHFGENNAVVFTNGSVRRGARTVAVELFFKKVFSIL